MKFYYLEAIFPNWRDLNSRICHPDRHYDNSMKLDPLYDGLHFPPYLYPPQIVMEINFGQDGPTTEYLCLSPQVSALISPDHDSCNDLNQLCRIRTARSISWGYAAYHGTLTLEELMRGSPVEQYLQGMGGLS